MNKPEINAMAEAISELARAITPPCAGGGASPTQDAAGGYVASLTEAMMGITWGLRSISESIGDLAIVIAESQGQK